MPGWEKIECDLNSLKRKETYNDFGKKIRFEPLRSIPILRKCNSYTDTYYCFRETLMWSENEELVEKTTAFVEFAKDKGFSEEQALLVLTYHNFDEHLAKYDLDIYRPLRGLRSDNDRQSIRLIVEKVRKRIESGKNRDLNLIMVEFPGHTIGELLDFYGSNRLYIKIKTAKGKDKRERVRRYCEVVDWSKCGSILRGNASRRSDLWEMLSLGGRSVERYLCDGGCREMETEIYQWLSSDLVNEEVDDGGREEEEKRVSEGLRDVLDDVARMEQWMVEMTVAVSEEAVVRHHWDNMDIGLLLLGLTTVGVDYVALSHVIGTKTAAMVESFYRAFGARYDLSDVVPAMPATASGEY